ncbi:MAG: hypothetical protein LBT62_07855, partial [Deltaproteobacteria bacterium]|nr:hypothetical protein [Deltaproteobacteria bacterium]
MNKRQINIPDDDQSQHGGASTVRADLEVSIGPLKLKNPIIAASGVFGYGLDLKEFCPPEKLGAIITKGLSLAPWPGNPGPRIVEAAGGLMNSIGL